MKSDGETDCKITRNTRYLEMKGKLCNRVDRKRCTIRPCLGHKFARHTEDTALKLKFHLYSKIKPPLGLESWTVLKSTSERQCRSKRKKELRGNPLQGRVQYWNRHQQAIGTSFRCNRENGSTSKCKDPGPYCFQMSKFITQLLRHKEVGREEDAGVPHYRLVEKCKEVCQRIQDIGQTKWKKIEHGSVLVSEQVDRRSVKRWWTEEKVSILFETKLSRKTRVPSSHSRSFRKRSFWKCSYQSCTARQCTVTKGFYQVCFITSETERNWDQ